MQCFNIGIQLCKATIQSSPGIKDDSELPVVVIAAMPDNINNNIKWRGRPAIAVLKELLPALGVPVSPKEGDDNWDKQGAKVVEERLAAAKVATTTLARRCGVIEYLQWEAQMQYPQRLNRVTNLPFLLAVNVTVPDAAWVMFSVKNLRFPPMPLRLYSDQVIEFVDHLNTFIAARFSSDCSTDPATVAVPTAVERHLGFSKVNSSICCLSPVLRPELRETDWITCASGPLLCTGMDQRPLNAFYLAFGQGSFALDRWSGLPTKGACAVLGCPSMAEQKNDDGFCGGHAALFSQPKPSALPVLYKQLPNRGIVAKFRMFYNNLKFLLPCACGTCGHPHITYLWINRDKEEPEDLDHTCYSCQTRVEQEGEEEEKEEVLRWSFEALAKYHCILYEDPDIACLVATTTSFVGVEDVEDAVDLEVLRRRTNCEEEKELLRLAEGLHFMYLQCAGKDTPLEELLSTGVTKMLEANNPFWEAHKGLVSTSVFHSLSGALSEMVNDAVHTFDGENPGGTKFRLFAEFERCGEEEKKTRLLLPASFFEDEDGKLQENAFQTLLRQTPRQCLLSSQGRRAVFHRRVANMFATGCTQDQAFEDFLETRVRVATPAFTRLSCALLYGEGVDIHTFEHLLYSAILLDAGFAKVVDHYTPPADQQVRVVPQEMDLKEEEEEEEEEVPPRVDFQRSADAKEEQKLVTQLSAMELNFRVKKQQREMRRVHDAIRRGQRVSPALLLRDALEVRELFKWLTVYRLTRPDMRESLQKVAKPVHRVLARWVSVLGENMCQLPPPGCKPAQPPPRWNLAHSVMDLFGPLLLQLPISTRDAYEHVLAETYLAPLPPNMLAFCDGYQWEKYVDDIRAAFLESCRYGEVVHFVSTSPGPGESALLSRGLFLRAFRYVPQKHGTPSEVWLRAVAPSFRLLARFEIDPRLYHPRRTREYMSLTSIQALKLHVVLGADDLAIKRRVGALGIDPIEPGSGPEEEMASLSSALFSNLMLHPQDFRRVFCTLSEARKLFENKERMRCPRTIKALRKLHPAGSEDPAGLTQAWSHIQMLWNGDAHIPLVTNVRASFYVPGQVVRGSPAPSPVPIIMPLVDKSAVSLLWQTSGPCKNPKATAGLDGFVHWWDRDTKRLVRSVFNPAKHRLPLTALTNPEELSPGVFAADLSFLMYLEQGYFAGTAEGLPFPANARGALQHRIGYHRKHVGCAGYEGCKCPIVDWPEGKEGEGEEEVESHTLYECLRNPPIVSLLGVKYMLRKLKCSKSISEKSRRKMIANILTGAHLRLIKHTRTFEDLLQTFQVKEPNKPLNDQEERLLEEALFRVKEQREMEAKSNARKP